MSPLPSSLAKIVKLRYRLRTPILAWVGWVAGRWTEQNMRVAFAAEECVGLALLWKLERAENACHVGHRHGRNGSAGLDGCFKEERQLCDIGWLA